MRSETRFDPRFFCLVKKHFFRSTKKKIVQVGVSHSPVRSFPAVFRGVRSWLADGNSPAGVFPTKIMKIFFCFRGLKELHVLSYADYNTLKAVQRTPGFLNSWRHRLK